MGWLYALLTTDGLLTADVEIAALSLIGVIITAILSYKAQIRAKQASATAAKSLAEVTNGHHLNLRVDLDQQFAAITDRLAAIDRHINAIDDRLNDQTHTSGRMMDRIDRLFCDLRHERSAREKLAHTLEGLTDEQTSGEK